MSSLHVGPRAIVDLRTAGKNHKAPLSGTKTSKGWNMRNRLVSLALWAAVIASLMGAADSCGSSTPQPRERSKPTIKSTSAPRQFMVIQQSDAGGEHKLLLCCEGEGEGTKVWYVIKEGDVRAYWEPCVAGKLFIPSEYEQGLPAGCGLTAP